IVRNGGQFVANTRSSSPQRLRHAIPCCQIKWVEIVSLGKVARSTSNTRWPRRASSIAVGEPAQRAPTTITSNMSPSIRSNSGILIPKTTKLFVGIPNVVQQPPSPALRYPDDAIVKGTVLGPSGLTSSAVHLTLLICRICCCQKAAVALRLHHSASGGDM